MWTDSTGTEAGGTELSETVWTPTDFGDDTTMAEVAGTDSTGTELTGTELSGIVCTPMT